MHGLEQGLLCFRQPSPSGNPAKLDSNSSPDWSTILVMYRICYSVNSGARQKVCIPVRLCRPCTDYSAVCVVVAVKDRLLCRHIQLSAESVDTRMSTSSISSSSRGSQLQPHVSTARWVARSAQRPSKTQKQPNLSLNSEFTVKNN